MHITKAPPRKNTYVWEHKNCHYCCGNNQLLTAPITLAVLVRHDCYALKALGLHLSEESIRPTPLGSAASEMSFSVVWENSSFEHPGQMTVIHPFDPSFGRSPVKWLRSGRRSAAQRRPICYVRIARARFLDVWSATRVPRPPHAQRAKILRAKEG